MTPSAHTLQATDLLSRLSPRERAELTVGRDGAKIAVNSSLGVRPVTVMDGPLGLIRDGEGNVGALVLPSGTCLGATFDAEIVRAVGRVLGDQARAASVDVVMGPNLNLPRQTRSGRSFEMFSEDPFLTGVLGSAWMVGLQEQGVTSCVKHVVCNDTETARQTMNVKVSDRDLRETYLLPFEYAVRNGARVMMTAYNRIRGKWGVEQDEVTSILRDEWGYDGVLMSDFFAKGSTAGASAARVDLEMPGPESYLGAKLADAIERGEIPQSSADRSAERIVDLALHVREVTSVPAAEIDAASVLRSAAAEGMVLLRNDNGMLPLRADEGRTIAVIGPNAYRPCFQGGTFGRVDVPAGTPTPLESLTAALAPSTVVSAEGATPEGMLPLDTLHPTTPAGDEGVLFEYFHDDADILAAETAPRASAVWWTQMPGTGSTFQPSKSRTTAVLTGGDTDRDILLHVGGTGAARLLVDGALVAEWERPDTADIMGVVARAENVAAPVVLRAHTSMTVVAEYSFEASRVQSAELGWSVPDDGAGLAEALRVAEQADSIILVVGDEVSSSRESADRTTTALPPAQVTLIESIAALGKPVAVVVNASRAVDLSWIDRVDAVLMTWFGGAQMSVALADVLTGERGPGGRLPITLAASDDDYPGFAVRLDAEQTLDYDLIEPAGYAGFVAERRQPRFAFGAGLSYTRFEWGQPFLGAVSPTGGTLSVPVSNVGDRSGKDVVQVYLRTPGAAVGKLVGFGSVRLEPGATTDVVVDIDDIAFRRWDAATHGWATLKGEVVLDVARSADDTLYSLNVDLGR